MRAFLGLGGNFARAISDISRTDPAWAGLDLVVHVATRLNRSHLMPGRETWLLPCLVRSEEDRQAGGPQVVSIEDSLSHIYASVGRRPPADAALLSEPAIVAGIAKAALPPDARRPWAPGLEFTKGASRLLMADPHGGPPRMALRRTCVIVGIAGPDGTTWGSLTM